MFPVEKVLDKNREIKGIKPKLTETSNYLFKQEMALALIQFFLRAVRCLTALYLPDGRVSNVIRASSATILASLSASLWIQ